MGALRPFVTAQMVLEPTNRFDPNAVRVDVGGATVGYLSRTDAPKWSGLLTQLAAEGIVPTCRARIIGGWDRGAGDEGHFGLRLLVDQNASRWSDEVPFLPDEHAMPMDVRVIPAESEFLAELVGKRRKTAKRVVATLADAGQGAVAVMVDRRWIGHVLNAPALLDLVRLVQSANCPTTASCDLYPGGRVTVCAYNPEAVAY